MTPEQFVYWLQGYTESLGDAPAPTVAGWKNIANHLQTVFDKVTPEVEFEPPGASIDPGFFQEAPPEGMARAPKAGKSRLIC